MSLPADNGTAIFGEEVKYCFYKDFRHEPEAKARYELTKEYWHVLASKLGNDINVLYSNKRWGMYQWYIIFMWYMITIEQPWRNGLARLQQWLCYLQGPGFESHLRPVEFLACNKVSPLNNQIQTLASVSCAPII